MKVVIISGSPRKDANTEVMMKHVFEYTKQQNADTKFINLSEGGFEYYRGFLNQVDYNEKTLQAARDITEADIWLIGTPIYNSMFSAALKNLFEFINYKETEGKTAGLAILGSGMIGFTDVQTLLTQIDIIIHHKEINNVNLFVRRSFSEHLSSWINDAASRL